MIKSSCSALIRADLIGEILDVFSESSASAEESSQFYANAIFHTAITSNIGSIQHDTMNVFISVYKHAANECLCDIDHLRQLTEISAHALLGVRAKFPDIHDEEELGCKACALVIRLLADRGVLLNNLVGVKTSLGYVGTVSNTIAYRKPPEVLS